MAAPPKPGIFSRIMGAVVGSVIGVVVGAVVGTIRGVGEFAKAGAGMFEGVFAPAGFVGGAILGAAVGAGIGIFQGIRHAIEQGAKNGFAAGCKGGAVGGATWDGPDAKTSVETEVKQDPVPAAKAAPKNESSEPSQDKREINSLINQFCSHSNAYMKALENKDVTAEKKRELRGKVSEALNQIDIKNSTGGLSRYENKQVQEMVDKLKKAESLARPAEKKPTPSVSSTVSATDEVKDKPTSPRMR